jgi:cytoskeletal protein RodZ
VSCQWVGYYAETGYFDETECNYLTSLAGASCCAPTNSPTTLPSTEASEPTVSPKEASEPAEPTPTSTTEGANSAGASSAGSSGTSPFTTPVVDILVLTGVGCLAFVMAMNS